MILFAKPFFSAFLAVLLASGLEAAETLVYKVVDNRELKLLVDKPEGWTAADRRPAMVFYFGGGWVGGTPEQFRRQSAYLATRGMVGVRVEYRVIPKGDSGPPVVCCADAKSAMRYVRSHAAELGIDPGRIAGAGGSAGGHLAAFTALVPGLDDPGDDLKVSCVPDALVLFNPVFNNGPGEWGNARVGARYKEFSPAHNVKKGAPPAIVFLGDKDDLIPVKVLEDFRREMEQAGSRCETHVYPGMTHGFFNSNPSLGLTMKETDRFLASLGWLKGEPAVETSEVLNEPAPSKANKIKGKEKVKAATKK
jgi:acetyl esterase